MGTMPEPGGEIYQPSLFSRLFAPEGGNAPTSLVSAEMLKRLERHSILAAGLGMMAQAHRPGQNSLAQGALAGLQAGQQSYSSGLEDSEKQALLSRKTAEEDKISQLDTAINAKYPAPANEKPQDKVQRLTNMAVDYAQGGDHKTAQNLIATANALRLAAGGSAGQYTYMQNNGVIYQIDKATGHVEQVAQNDLPAARLALGQGNLDTRREAMMQRQGNKFQSSNPDLYKRAVLLNQALLTIKNAREGNPALYASVIANVVQSADQNARLQIQMLNYFKTNIDPSFTGTLQVMADRIRSGKYPPRILRALENHLNDLKTLANQEWTDRRNGEIRRHPSVAPWIAKSEELYSEPALLKEDGSLAPPTAAGDGDVGDLDNF